MLTLREIQESYDREVEIKKIRNELDRIALNFGEGSASTTEFKELQERAKALGTNFELELQDGGGHIIVVRPDR